jgi:lysophospholipase L1-like esterase
MITRTRFLSSLGVILLAASGLIAAGALPATAAPVAPINRYVALGDSYAAGQGADPYLNACLQSTNGYPAVLDSVKGTNLLRNASCRGATTEAVVATQLSALNRGTTLVTLTVGGNDLNVDAVAAACKAAVPVGCQAALTAASALLGSGVFANRLATTYADVAVAAPHARILVTGYPYLFETPGVADPNFATISAVNSATTALNATIAGVVAQAHAAGADIHYVDVTAAFALHGIGSIDPWIGFAGLEAFHPNAAGYRAFAIALEAAL